MMSLITTTEGEEYLQEGNTYDHLPFAISKSKDRSDYSKKIELKMSEFKDDIRDLLEGSLRSHTLKRLNQGKMSDIVQKNLDEFIDELIDYCDTTEVSFHHMVKRLNFWFADILQDQEEVFMKNVKNQLGLNFQNSADVTIDFTKD